MIEIDHLSFQYPGSKPVLKDLSLTINDGEVVAIIGPSGSGKTTLLKHLKKELIPKGRRMGQVYYNNEPLKEVKEAYKIGYVFQDPSHQIVEDYVYHEIAFGLENRGIDRQVMKTKVAEIVQYFHLEDIYDKRTSELSGGEKQLLNLASVMVMQPDTLLLDEPLAQLDPKARELFVSILERLHHDFGITIIIVSHQLDEIYDLIDKVLVLDEGKQLCFDKKNQAVRQLKGTFMMSYFPQYIQLLSMLDLDIATSFYQSKELINPLKSKERVYQENEPVISIRHLYAGYKSDVLFDLSVDIAKQEMFCIVGSNGSGKTTFLRCLLDDMKHKGKVTIQGKIGYLPQDPLLLINKDRVGDELKPFKNKDALIDYFGFNDLMDIHPYDLSGGQQQLLALMKLLLNGCDILLLDEPTKGIDPIMKEKLGHCLEKLIAQGMTIVLVSHDLEFCGTYGTKITMLFHHQLSDPLRPKEFFSNHYFYTTQLAKLTRDDNYVIALRDVVL